MLAILLTVVVHFVGIFVLIAFAGGDIMDIFRSKPREDDGGGQPFEEPPGDPTPPTEGILLPPDATQSPVRLREPGRIAEHYKRPARRPEHVPAPAERPAAPQP